MPLLSLTLLRDPEVEGSEVYFSVVIDSYWGTKILSNSDSLNMRVNGVLAEQATQSRPLKVTVCGSRGLGSTQPEWRGDRRMRRSSWSCRQAVASLSGTSDIRLAIETFDSDSGGTGTYYPPDEPLQTDGDGSPIEVCDWYLRHLAQWMKEAH